MRKVLMVVAIVVLVAGSVTAGSVNFDLPKNKERVFEAKVGKFRVVSCWGAYSTDPKGKSPKYSDWSQRFDMIQTPDEKWHKGYPEAPIPGNIIDFVTVGKKTPRTLMVTDWYFKSFYEYSDGAFLTDPGPPRLRVAWTPTQRIGKGEVPYYELRRPSCLTKGGQFAGIRWYDIEKDQWCDSLYSGPKLERIRDWTLDKDGNLLLFFDTEEGKEPKDLCFYTSGWRKGGLRAIQY